MSQALRRLFLAIPLLWIALAHLAPLLALVRISLLDAYPALPEGAHTASLAAYGAFWMQAGYRLSLARSLALAAATTLGALLLAYPLAYHVAFRVAPDRRGRRLMLLVAPFWTSEVLRMFAVVLLLSNRGAVNSMLRGLGITTAPIPLLYGDGAVVAGMIYTVLLCMLLPLYAALDRLPRDLLDAAATLGAGAWRRFWYVTVPLTMRGIVSGAVLTFTTCLGVVVAPALLGGARVPVFATVIVDLFGAASGRWPMATAFGFIMLLVGLVVSAALAVLPAVTRLMRQI